MTVVIIIDKCGVEEAGTGIMVQASHEIYLARKRIREHLLNSDADSELRVIIKPDYQIRFADFIGLEGIVYRVIEPHIEFAIKFGIPVPEWLTNDWIKKLNILDIKSEQNEFLDRQNDVTGWILYCLDTRLIQPNSWDDFCACLFNSPLPLADLLTIRTVRERISFPLQVFFKSLTAAERFLEACSRHSNAGCALIHYGQQQIYEQVRNWLVQHQFDFPLPARFETAELLNSIPLITLSEEQAGTKILNELSKILEEAFYGLDENRCTLESFTTLLVGDWPTLFDKLIVVLPSKKTSLATQEFLDLLAAFKCSKAADLAKHIRDHLTACEPLPEQANIESATHWLTQYLSYAKRRFMADQEPDEASSDSFSRWFIQQQPRIARSALDWRSISKAITRYLQQPDTRVIVCMVDALSALHSEEVINLLKDSGNLEGFTVKENIVLAPYPTLTEVGKHAVLTGKAVTETTGTPENRLFTVYGHLLPETEAIHVIKSWNDKNSAIPSKTRLLIYFENRLDDRLHGNTRYSRFAEDVTVITKQLVKEINQWITKTRRHGLEPVLIITADHGLTCINNQTELSAQDHEEAECLERTIRFKTRVLERTGYYRIDSGGSTYLMPQSRTRLAGKNPLTHGGVTPEELAIPFIVLQQDNQPVRVSGPINLALRDKNAHPRYRGWDIHMNLTCYSPIQQVSISAIAPFIGEYKLGDRPESSNEIPFTLPLSANIPQTGLVQVEFLVTLHRPDLQAHEELRFSLPVNFQNSAITGLVERTEATEAFNGMF